MTEAEEFEAWAKARVLATNIIGFYDLAETPTAVQNEVQRLNYEAQVYAGGLALARLLFEIMAATGPRMSDLALLAERFRRD